MESDQPADTKSLFEELFRDFRGPILNYLYRLIGDASRAEELTQDVFVKAYRALVRLPADANHRAWLYRIATNTAYDHLRRRKLVQWLPLLDRDVPDLAHNNPETALGEQESVQQALAQLAPKYRAPLILSCARGIPQGLWGGELTCTVRMFANSLPSIGNWVKASKTSSGLT
jgi:RNA polymerase sigma-70 factor (ECF subfamily)